MRETTEYTIPFTCILEYTRLTRFISHICARATKSRQLFQHIMRGLVYGLQALVLYGNLREQTGENGFPQIPTGSLFCSYRNLTKSPETSGSLRENII